MPTYPPAATSGGNLLSPGYGRPTGRAPVATVGFVDPLELVETVGELLSNTWQQVVTDKAATLRTELAAQAAATAATGSALPFPGNFVAGFVGKSLVQPGSVSLLEYAGFAQALNAQLLAGKSIAASAPGFAGRVIRFSSGPVGLGITSAAVARYRAFPPDAEGRSLAWAVVQELLTSGIDDITPRNDGGIGIVPGTLIVRLLGENNPLVPSGQLQLLPFWTKDDP